MTGGVRLGVAAALALVSLLVAPGSAPAANVFGGQNGLIAFTEDNGPFSDIVTIQPDGQNRINLTNNQSSGTMNVDSSPSWSPDGSILSITRDPPGGASADIVLLSHAGANLGQLTNGSNSFDGESTFSFDGGRLALTHNDGSAYRINLMNLDGTGMTPVTPGPNDFFGSLSPVDNSLAFNAGAGSTVNIFRVNTDGSGLTQLTNGGINLNPSFSPDGQFIVYTEVTGGNSDIVRINADGTNRVPLITGPANDSGATFSPNGMQIAFNRTEAGTSRIATMPATGGEVSFVTNGPNDSQPAWQARNDPELEIAGRIRTPANHKNVVVPITGPRPFDFEAIGHLNFVFDGNRARLASRKVNLKPARGSVAAGETVQAKLKVPKKGRKLIDKALDARSKVKGSVTVTATNALGATAEEKSGFKLKPKK